MNLTCTNKGKFANLTANKVYEGVEEGELYVVVNDIGARARYAKKYFRETPNAAVPAAPAPPPRPVTVNLLDIANIQIDTEADNGIGFSIGFGAGINSFRHTIREDSSAISCGINQLTGIHGVGRMIQNAVDALPARIVNRDVDALCTRVVDQMFQELRDDENKAFYLLSDSAEENDPFQRALDNIAEYSSTLRNPNSGNDITLWVIDGTPQQ